MVDSTEENEALEILQSLISQPFEDCVTVGREFPTLTAQHSIYAVRHQTEGLLYIGKSQTQDCGLRVGIKPWFGAGLNNTALMM